MAASDIKENIKGGVDPANYSYNSNGLSIASESSKRINDTYDTRQSIEVLVKALGTMVIEPVYEADPNQIGKKRQVGAEQAPILREKNREVAVNKLVELINTL